MYKCLIEYNNFDALGHIDYIDRYFQNKELIPKFNVYEKEVNKVLELLIEKDKALELNTAGTRSGLFYFSLKAGPRKEVMPMEQFLSDVAAHVVGGVLVAFILRRIFRR